MNLQHLIFVICIALLTLSGCKKTELDGNYANYEGQWHGPGITLDLHRDGTADYDSNGAGLGSLILQGRLVIKGNTLKISSPLTFNVKKFRINTPPTKLSSGNFPEYIMRLDGMEFYRSY